MLDFGFEVMSMSASESRGDFSTNTFSTFFGIVNVRVADPIYEVFILDGTPLRSEPPETISGREEPNLLSISYPKFGLASTMA